jgi:hypothetical protein
MRIGATVIAACSAKWNLTAGSEAPSVARAEAGGQRKIDFDRR